MTYITPASDRSHGIPFRVALKLAQLTVGSNCQPGGSHEGVAVQTKLDSTEVADASILLVIPGDRPGPRFDGFLRRFHFDTYFGIAAHSDSGA